MSLYIRPVTVDVAAILAQVQLLHGEAPGVGTTVANWNSGVATSGGAGGDLVTIGANDIRRKIHHLDVRIGGLTAAATITIRLYKQVNGVDTEFYNQDWVVGTDPDSITVVDGVLGTHEAVRCEVYSDNALDDAFALPYDYFTEAM